ncbi:MAG TPA: type II toxin-antitoxin system HicB family antitoxin [Ktedonobacterales bacterium]|nr:type II toxin-antitoxin system HicB family antitoxin [Ktedonobacterales bacterium]
MTIHYSMTIQWSDEDQVYIVSFPEWGGLLHTHGDSYAEAVKNGQELLEGLVQSRRQHGEPLPAPRIYATA